MNLLHFDIIEPDPSIGVGGSAICKQTEEIHDGRLRWRIVHYWRDRHWVVDTGWDDTEWQLGFHELPLNWCWA